MAWVLALEFKVGYLERRRLFNRRWKGMPDSMGMRPVVPQKSLALERAQACLFHINDAEKIKRKMIACLERSIYNIIIENKDNVTTAQCSRSVLTAIFAVTRRLILDLMSYTCNVTKFTILQ